MPASSGFGRSRFGNGPFGEADFAHNIWWLGVPAVHRDADTTGLLETLLRGYGGGFDRIRHKIRDLPALRNPLHVRTRYNEAITVDITGSAATASEDSEDGLAYITFSVSTPTIPNLETVSKNWVMEDSSRNYFVRSVNKVDGAFSVYGDDLPILTTQTIRPPSIIEFLGKDFDVKVDGHEPEGFQRGLISEVVRWYDLKGTEKGIRLRSELAGFSATVRSLWSVSEGYASLIPVSNLFELESGSFYTDIHPGFVQFDHIPADIIALDTICSINEVEFPITVTAVTVVGDQFRLTVSTPLTMIASEDGTWLVILGDDEFYVEDIDVTNGYIFVAGEVTPITGAYTLQYDCQPVNECGWCKSYKVILDLVPTNTELLASPIALNGAFERLIEKIQAILPAHVQVIYTLVTEGSATVELLGSGDSETYVFDSYDTVPADAHPTDTPTLIISA
jgi:hypothetical protein